MAERGAAFCFACAGAEICMDVFCFACPSAGLVVGGVGPGQRAAHKLIGGPPYRSCWLCHPAPAILQSSLAGAPRSSNDAPKKVTF